jgi:hypothetical protein
MAGEVKINVGAGLGNVEAAIAKITAQMNKLGAAVAKSQNAKFEDTSVKLMARDLALVNKQFAQAIQLSSTLKAALTATGQSGLNISQVDFSKLSTDPRAAERLRNRAFLHAVRGTSLDPTLANEVDADGNIVPAAPPAAPPGGSGGGGRRRPPRGGGHSGEGGSGEGHGSWWTRRPEGSFRSAAAMAIGNGIGGPVGNMITAGLGGGLPGIALSGLTSAIGAAVSFASEGVGLAKQQNEVVDLLKRQMGDVGVSFDQLTRDMDTFSKGLGVSNGELAKLAMQANQASGGAYATPDELARATRSGADLARAYGLSPGEGVAFMSGMRRMNSRQDDKRLAIDIAEAINNAQGHATPGEVMQAMMGFVSAQNRLNGGVVDPNRFGNAYASLMNEGATSDRAQSILGTANSAMQNMGGTEASQNFTMQAFGTLDPVRAQMRAEGGIFSNGLDSRNIGAFMRSRGVKGWDDMDKGPDGTNADLVVKRFDDIYAGRGAYGREMEINALKNYFHFKSYDDTAAFANMGTGDHNGIMMVLKNAGVKPEDVREGGLQGIAAISRATSAGDLQKLWNDELSKRADVTDSDRDLFARAAKGGNLQDMQDSLVRIFSGKGQADDDGSVQRSIDANIATIQSDIGQKLIPITQAVMQGVLAMANKLPGINIQDPEAEGGSMFVGPAKPAPTETASHVAHRAAAPSAPAAPGGSTVGGAGNARMLRGPVNAGASPFGDSAASLANGVYGAAVGGAYSVNGSVIGGMQQLVGMGIDKTHAAAIMASAVRESSMNPAARNGSHYGLFQLDEARQKDFQRVMGKSITGSSAREQIDYMVKSMQAGGEEAGPGKGFWSSSGADAAGYFARKIERTDHPGKESDIRKGIADQLEANITINFEQHNTSASGAKKTQKMSTTVSKPMASGMLPNNPIIVTLPPSQSS